MKEMFHKYKINNFYFQNKNKMNSSSRSSIVNLIDWKYFETKEGDCLAIHAEQKLSKFKINN